MQMIVTDIYDGGRTRQTWNFYLFERANEFEIVLDHWAYQTLPPRARKWRIRNWWDRLDNRNNVTKEHPPIPADIGEQAKGLFCQRLHAAVIKE